MPTKQQKLRQAIELNEAIKKGQGEFVLLKKLDTLEDKIDNIKIPDKVDLSETNKRIEELKNEEIEVNLEIV